MLDCSIVYDRNVEITRVLFGGEKHLVLHDRNSASNLYHDRFNHSLGGHRGSLVKPRDSTAGSKLGPLSKKKATIDHAWTGNHSFPTMCSIQKNQVGRLDKITCFFTAHEVEEGATTASHHGVANQHWFSFFKRTSSSICACRVWSRATYLFNMFNRSYQTIQIIDMLHAERFVVAGYEWIVST